MWVQGYFIPAKPGDPIHHRWAFVRVPDSPGIEKTIRADLRAQGVFLTVPGPDKPAFTGAEVTRWTDDQIAASVEKNFHQPLASGIPSVLFTLNEAAYASSLEHLEGKTPEDMHDLYQIAERDVRLTADELLWLDRRRHFESVFRDNIMEEEYQHRFCPFLSDERLEQLSDGAGPRAQELKFLIGRYGKDHARTGELHQSLQNPRWTKRWPLWEQHERQVKKELAALAEIWAHGLLPYPQAEPLLKAKGLDLGSWQYHERVRKEAERRGIPPPPPPPAAGDDLWVDPDFLADVDALDNEPESTKEV
jgi:hypothetical protein